MELKKTMNDALYVEVKDAYGEIIRIYLNTKEYTTKEMIVRAMKHEKAEAASSAPATAPTV